MIPSILPVPPSDFIGLDGVAHLAAAGEAPVLASQPGIFAKYARDKARGLDGIISIYSRVEQARTEVARLLNVGHDEIGFPLNVGQAMSAIARTMVKTGGNVVLCQWEFTSAMSPWVTGTQLEVRLLKAKDCLFNMNELARLVDSNTRAIVVSLVSYYTGQRVDLTELRLIADRAGAALIIDASHGMGAVQFDPQLADFVISCAYKWMLGVHGAAIAYCNAERQPMWLPLESGWRSVYEVDALDRDTSVVRRDDGSRFESGNPAILSVLLTGEGARYLNAIGTEAVEHHLLALTGGLLRRLDEMGLEVLTPRLDSERAGIVSFKVSNASEWKIRFGAEGILAWITEGRVRLSPHVFTTQSDVDRALDVIASLLGS